MSKAKRPISMLSDEEEAQLQEQIAADPDSPELADDELAAMRPATEVLPPALYTALTRPRGRPKAEVTKVPVKLRLDPETLERFRANGPGWQTRMGTLLGRNELVLKMIGENLDLIDSMETMLGYIRKGELRTVFEPIETTIATVERNIRNVTETTRSLRDQLIVE